MEATNTSITQHLEGFIHSAKKLEESLSEERKRSQKIAQDYLSTRTKLEHAVRELQTRVLQRENKIQALSEALRHATLAEERLKNDVRELAEKEKKSATELAQYQSAWNEVLAREAHARNIVVEHEKTKLQLEEAHRTAAAHFRSAENYHRELQAAIARVKVAESKHESVRKELAAATQRNKNVDEEIARLESSLRARFANELENEKNRLRADRDHTLAVERERIRDTARRQAKSEMESAVAAEREAREAAENARRMEIERARARLLALTEENERAKQDIRRVLETKTSEIDALHERLERAERSADALRTEIAMYRLEAANHEAKLEISKKESTKTLLIERLRFEASLEAMQKKLEQLRTSGFYVEKVDSLPDGVEAVLARPAAADSPNSPSLTEQSNLSA